VRAIKIFALAAPILLYGASAWAAGAGSPLATPATQLVTALSGPGALIMIACGFIGAGVTYFVSRDFTHAFLVLGALVVGGVLASQIQTFAAYFFPNAVATIALVAKHAAVLAITR
jgi:hypothetical protein